MTLGLVVRLELFDAHERHTKRKQDELHERLGPATIRLTEGVTADGKPGMRLRFGDLDRVVRFAAPGSLVRLDPEWDQVLDEVAKRIPRAATGWIGLRFDVASALRKEPHDIATELLIDRIRSLAGPAPWERDFDGAPAIR
jgi:hypothetical protein